MASILLLCQIGILESYPVVNKGEQNHDVSYRDNANSGVTMEEIALQRNADSNDHRNGTLSSFFSSIPAHARVARHTHPCVDVKSRSVISCDNERRITAVSCREASHACNHRIQGNACVERKSSCTVNRKLVVFTIDCQCL